MGRSHGTLTDTRQLRLGLEFQPQGRTFLHADSNTSLGKVATTTTTISSWHLLILSKDRKFSIDDLSWQKAQSTLPASLSLALDTMRWVEQEEQVTRDSELFHAIMLYHHRTNGLATPESRHRTPPRPTVVWRAEFYTATPAAMGSEQRLEQVLVC
jgi:hypothetical protein